jgi:hypothetical protein
VTFILRAWDKEGLADKITKAIEPYPPEQVVSIRCGIDFQFFFPLRRNWALVVVHGMPLE